MNTQERSLGLHELSQIYSLGMHQYINAAIYSENDVFVQFFEKSAYERMIFVHDIQYRIGVLEGSNLKMTLEEMLDAWQNACAFHKLEETFFITNDIGYIDKKAIYHIGRLLTEELSEESTSLIMGHILKIESGLKTLDYLLGSLDL